MALLLSCVPALFEGVAITLLAPSLLGLTTLEAAILGAVISAVSPAVVVPLMIRFSQERRGVDKGIPTLLLAASSIDGASCSARARQGTTRGQRIPGRRRGG